MPVEGPTGEPATHDLPMVMTALSVLGLVCTSVGILGGVLLYPLQEKPGSTGPLTFSYTPMARSPLHRLIDSWLHLARSAIPPRPRQHRTAPPLSHPLSHMQGGVPTGSLAQQGLTSLSRPMARLPKYIGGLRVRFGQICQKDASAMAAQIRHPQHHMLTEGPGLVWLSRALRLHSRQ